MWPWIRRSAVVALEERLRWTEAQMHQFEERAAEAHGAAESMRQLLVETKTECIEKEHKLLDRIMVLSGQAPLYEQPARPEPVAETSTAPAPVPERRVTRREMSAAFKKAANGGTLDPSKLRIY